MGEAFNARLFSLFISLYLSNMVRLLFLLPRFCYAEILGLALFVLWLRWSLYQSFMVFIVTAVFPHTHAELLIFSYFLPEYSLVYHSLCWSKTLHSLLFFFKSKILHGWHDTKKKEKTEGKKKTPHNTTQKKSRPHCFFVTHDSWLCCFSVCCHLMPSIEMP